MNKKSAIHWEFVVVFVLAIFLFLLVVIFLFPGVAQGFSNFLDSLRI